MDQRIATPRRKSPILDLPAGSVSIGGVQTGVSASAGPSGWNTIGRTEMSFFDHRLPAPALLQPGDLIRFQVRGIEK
jgi:allophanate hydrolase subunit 1